ncbi:MAG: AMP-binding protein [Desulfobacteraceae bacterium]|jgi:acyl-CoA synthetase (AMP-forming)/AMP-acid ligase II|nr:AMP-binding protein [Desulfobacteraceae bacterium]
MSIIRKSIGELISDIAQRNSDRDALVHAEAGQRYSYQDLAREIDLAARGFLNLGIRPGDKIALWSANVPEWMIAFLGLAKLGAVTVPIDPAATADNLYYILEQSESRGLIVADSDGAGGGMLTTASAAKNDIPLLEDIIIINSTSDPDRNSWNELIAAGENTTPDMMAKISGAVNPEDPVAIMYTSGTTGQPKGVVLDHLGLINKSMVSTQRQGISADDRLCLFFPLFHMFGNTCIALAGLLRGAALIMPCRSFAPAKVLTAIPGEKCTAIYGSPSMLIALIDNPEFARDDWATLSKGIIGGAPCPMELMRRIVEDIGVSDITVAYGITETSSWITMTHPADALELRVSTIGRPLACNEVKIVDPATGHELAPDQQGELCTRGFLMKEYYKMPAATAAAVDREKWFHTGDLGVMDPAGYVRITGRLKDVITRNDVEIYPVEIEETIYMLPEISEVQVFGFPDQHKGQEVAAWIKLKENSTLSLDAVEAHVRARLPVAQHPKYYKIVSEFPMTGSGKIQKFKMALLAEEEYVD